MVIDYMEMVTFYFCLLATGDGNRANDLLGHRVCEWRRNIR